MTTERSPIIEKPAQSGRNTIANLRRQDRSYKYSIQRLLSNLSQSVSHLFLSIRNEKLHNKMCENYGHNVSNQKWEHGRLRCRDCGSLIQNDANLRKSTLK